MEEPPAKRMRRMDSAALWDDGKNKHGSTTASPRSPRSHETKSTSRAADSMNGGYTSRREDERRRRSRSPRDRQERSKRERSRSGNRSYRDRDRDRDRDRGGRDSYVRRERHRSRSQDRHRKHRSKSRSPPRTGNTTSGRARSPAKVSTRDDRQQGRPEGRDAKPDPGVTDRRPNGTATKVDDMDVDDDDTDAALKKMMGFSNFKTTQNQKVPGNQIYGVRKEKKTEYRQYMNRVGGFNRPLSPGR